MFKSVKLDEKSEMVYVLIFIKKVSEPLVYYGLQKPFLLLQTNFKDNIYMTSFPSGFAATILADSISPDGVRLTTVEATFPRLILSELNTHRILSKNSASSRAIPVVRQIRKIISSPFIPERIGSDKAGMQASRFLEGEELAAAQKNVIIKRDRAIIGALEDLVGRVYVAAVFGDDLNRIFREGFNDADLTVVEAVLDYYSATAKAKRLDESYDLPEGFLNLHKQTLNRYLEPFMYHTAILSGTDWSNFFALRAHENAQPEIEVIARLIRGAMENSNPESLAYGEWHLPFVQPEEKKLITPENIEEWKLISSGRTARVSYETHDGKRDIQKDVSLATGLIADGHMSPFEHIATPVSSDEKRDLGNFKGWLQMRKEIPFESDYSLKA